MQKVLVGIVIITLLGSSIAQTPAQRGTKSLRLRADRTFQKIDGFGVNVTPAQWRDGKLKPILDQLVDDLGATLIRFDCWGKADWLDPARRSSDGRYPEAYLAEVYSGQVFRDAWETFRYFNSKGIEPFFSVSGRIPPALAGPDGQTLRDYQGYAEMVVTMLEWARNREKLRFSLLSPFNETDLGFPEGPRISANGCVDAARAVVKRLDQAGLNDVRLILMDEANPAAGYAPALAKAPDLVTRMAAFATHCYGNGADEDGGNWFMDRTPYSRYLDEIAATRLPLWLTEYGDLDQTEEVEFGVAWRSTRRLLKRLNEGLGAGLAWDAFDNLHEHDAAWAIYGLFKTDRSRWRYTPKRRYYSARQVYRFVKPGFLRAEISGAARDPNDVFATWHEPTRHLLLSAYVSPDRRDFTIVGMSTVEADTELRIAVEGIEAGVLEKKIAYYRTSRNEDCRRIGEASVSGSEIRFVVPENSIFTVTTLE